ncbi:hypothetical protein [Thalassobacillus sp. CUG 92003]|nr:hypothetical protein [Thalassobacillus sp. CUG 92003]
MKKFVACVAALGFVLTLGFSSLNGVGTVEAGEYDVGGINSVEDGA